MRFRRRATITPRSFNNPEADPMTEIEGIARQQIQPGKLEEFKALQMQCMAITRSKDTGGPVRIFTPYQSL